MMLALTSRVIQAATTAVNWTAAVSQQVATERHQPGEDDDPEIEVWFVEGCGETFAIGDELHLRYQANVTDWADIRRMPDEELFVRDLLVAGTTYEIVGPVTGPPGQWWILGELLASGATATCAYTTTAASATATVTATASTATSTGSAFPTRTATPTATASPSSIPTSTSTVPPTSATPTAIPTPTMSATPTAGSEVPTATPIPATQTLAPETATRPPRTPTAAPNTATVPPATETVPVATATAVPPTVPVPDGYVVLLPICSNASPAIPGMARSPGAE